VLRNVFQCELKRSINLAAYVFSRRAFAAAGLAGAIVSTASCGRQTARQSDNSQQADTVQTVTSKDGTRIAFDRSGEGPALIVIGGALSDRAGGAPFAAQLSPRFTVFSVDRRGRGDSGDTQPYAVDREIEDIEALIDEAGGSAFVLGTSSGAALSLHVASRLPAKINKLALYEPPFIIDDSRPLPSADYIQQINQLVAADRRGDAVAFFFTEVVGMPAEAVTQMRSEPSWSGLEALAHTLAYDGTVLGDTLSGNPLPAQRWASATMPTLVMAGGASPDWMRATAQAVAEALPNAQYRALEGQTHQVSPETIAPVLDEFFRAGI
jgi:pimeloyl-ACP methyl ester carboxylesterase